MSITAVRNSRSFVLCGLLASSVFFSSPAWSVSVSLPQTTAPPSAGLHAQQVLSRGNGAEPETLDPALYSTTGAGNILQDLFEGLTSTDAGGNVVGGVADSWTRIDPLTWEFHLRPAKWSNGDPVTAGDFVYSWRRFFDPNTASAYASTFDTFFENAEAIVEGAEDPDMLGVEAIAPDRLQIRTPHPLPFLPEVLAHASFMPVHAGTIAQHGSQWTRPGNMVSNGAFMLDQWRVNDRIVARKNPSYWDAEAVRLTEVRFLPIEDLSAEMKMFVSGELDFTSAIPPGAYATLQRQRPDEVRNTRTLGLRYYSLNNTDPLLADKRVRQALSMVIDRDVLAQRIVADGGAPAYSALVPGMRGGQERSYEWVVWPMEKRVAEAKKLLKNAGIAPDTKLNLTYNTSEYHKRMALFIASEWKTKLGLKTELENMEFRVLLKRRQEGDYQVARDAWIADFNDATSMLTIVRCDSVQNSNRNCNREAEGLLRQAQNAPDDDARTALHTSAADLIMHDYPMIPLMQITSPRLVKTYVGGFGQGNALDRTRSRELYILEH